MLRNRFTSIASVAGAALLGFAVNANAVILNNSFVAENYLDTGLGGTTSAARPELAGTVLEDVIQDYDYGALNIAGTVQNRVVREDGTGTLDFYWRVKVNGRSTGGGVEAFRLDNFGYTDITDADWRIDGLGSAAPYTARLFNPATHPNGAINFLFTDPAVQPALDSDALGGSRFFFLHTSATNYAKTAEYDLLAGPNQSLSGLFTTFAPSTVPENSSALMLGLGLAALALATRKRG